MSFKAALFFVVTMHTTSCNFYLILHVARRVSFNVSFDFQNEMLLFLNRLTFAVKALSVFCEVGSNCLILPGWFSPFSALNLRCACCRQHVRLQTTRQWSVTGTGAVVLLEVSQRVAVYCGWHRFFAALLCII